MSMIVKLYSKYYHICVLMVSPRDQGHAGVARDRVYLILTLKSKVEQIFNPQDLYNAITEYITARVQTRPRDYLVSDNVDLLLEATRVSSVRKIPLRQDCHLVNWLDAADSVWLNKTHFKDEKRAKLVSALMFNTGWTLDDPKPGMLVFAECSKEDVFSQAKSRYETRGKPAAHTAWGAKEMHLFMKYQHHLIKKGSLRRSKLGGFAWDLPSKGADGRPAPLPKAVLDFHRMSDDQCEEDRKKPGRAEENKDKKKDQITDFTLESGSDDDGTVISAKGEDASLCSELLRDGGRIEMKSEGRGKKSPEEKQKGKISSGIAKVSNDPALLKGMKAKDVRGTGSKNQDGPKPKDSTKEDSDDESLRTLSSEPEVKDKKEPSDSKPFFEKSEDGERFILIDPKLRKCVPLPRGEEWTVEFDDGKACYMLGSVSGKYKHRTVGSLLASSRATDWSPKVKEAPTKKPAKEGKTKADDESLDSQSQAAKLKSKRGHGKHDKRKRAPSRSSESRGSLASIKTRRDCKGEKTEDSKHKADVKKKKKLSEDEKDKEASKRMRLEAESAEKKKQAEEKQKEEAKREKIEAEASARKASEKPAASSATKSAREPEPSPSENADAEEGEGDSKGKDEMDVDSDAVLATLDERTADTPAGG
eukprot:s253_g26.t1